MAVQQHPPCPRRVTPTANFLADVRRGLRRPRKELPCKYFYDARGSELFDAICELDEYYPTRTELAITAEYAGEMARHLGRDCLLVEYGTGSGVKTRLLLDRLEAPAGYVPVDISGSHLARAAAALAARYPGLAVRPVCADFTRPFALPRPGRPAARTAVYFPGSTVGNFTPPAAVRLLRGMAALVGPGGGLLIGADRKKDARRLEAAYDDARGVTAAFNRNLLVRINRELGADFAVERFRHRAVYNERRGRVEMHLVSDRPQAVHLAGETFRFAAGEGVRTECSYKYGPGEFEALAARAGFRPRALWADAEGLFAVHFLTVGG
jgi:dimethylhistidine N-methyltransferase